MAAAHFGHEEGSRLLMGMGIDADATESDGWTALHHSAASGWVPVTELLLCKEAEVDKADERGLTPLMSASHQGQLRQESPS